MNNDKQPGSDGLDSTEELLSLFNFDQNEIQQIGNPAQAQEDQALQDQAPQLAAHGSVSGLGISGSDDQVPHDQVQEDPQLVAHGSVSGLGIAGSEEVPNQNPNQNAHFAAYALPRNYYYRYNPNQNPNDIWNHIFYDPRRAGLDPRSIMRSYTKKIKFVNDLHGLISPPAAGTPLPLIFLGKSKNALLSTFLFLDQIVWAHRTGIYKNKERAELIGRISLYCWLGSSTCTSLIEVAEIKRLSKSMKKLKSNDEQYELKLKKSNERLLALVKSSMDIVVAVGLLQLAPKKVTPRVTGALGLASSLISCYQLLPAPAKAKVN